MSRSYHVDWFVSRDAIADVTVRICDDQRVSVEQGRSVDAIDLGSVALIDGLVNAHTHLEFSSLARPISPTHRFTDWIRAVIQFRQENSQTVGSAIGAGIRESIESGTTLLGEIATSGWSDSDYRRTEFAGVIFQEVLGLLPDRISGQMNLAKSHLKSVGASSSISSTRTVDRKFLQGLSPHAPYSTHPDLVKEAVELAKSSKSSVAMHIAETQAELELLATGRGEFREMLEEFGLWRNEFFPGGRKPIDDLTVLAQAPRALVVHGNYLADDELAFLAAHSNMTLVYCPRTHSAFRHADHPWLRLKEQGGRVAIGTDSRASNPDLSLFAELQFLAARNPGMSHIELLQLGSVNGRQALGFDDGCQVNLTLVRLSDPSFKDPKRSLFAAGNSVCGTVMGGHWAWLADDLRERLHH